MSKISSIQQDVLRLTSMALFNKEYLLTGFTSSTYNWEMLKKESYNQAVFLLVYSVISDYLPESEKESWLDLSEKITAKNMTTDYEHSELHDLMVGQNIPYTTIKGSGAASYYPDPLKRMMGDVDFLVDKKDVARAGKTLESVGFICKREHDDQSHLVYNRGISTWELHFSVVGIPNDRVGMLIRKYLSDIIEKSVIYNNSNCNFRMPEPFHHGIIMLIHTAVHAMSTGIGLRHLCDWAVFVNSFQDGQFENIFKERLKSVGLWNYSCILTSLSEKYLGLRHCKWTESINEPSDLFLEKMIMDILDGGNFGRKDQSRIVEYKLISDLRSRRINRYGYGIQLIKSMNIKSEELLPIIKKHFILRPLGWIYTGVWYGCLVIQNKRPAVTISNVIKGAKKRREIYKQFKLFEVD